MRYAAIVLALAGCAELPTCPKPTALEMEHDGKNYYILDAANLNAMWKRAEGLAKGECK